MIEIGGKPILWHIMKHYTYHGINEFIICLGYKGYCIKEYFANYYLHMSDVTFDMASNSMEVHCNHCEPWKVTLLDTGLNTQTGGRLKRAAPYLGGETFCFTYGDGLSDVDITALVEYHKEQKARATVTIVQPPGRFGVLDFEGTKVQQFREKPKGESGWINGGFFVLEPEVMDYITDENTVWEKEPLENLASDGQLCAYKHEGFWLGMDTLRDRKKLEELWAGGTAPWRLWDREPAHKIEEIPAKPRDHFSRIEGGNVQGLL
jgi:glucose-1-phosphate cytidylyltransferase